MLRRSELSGACVTDLARDPRGSATLLVPRSKTDPGGRSATVYIARDTMAILAEWLQRSGIADGRLFRSVGKDGSPRRPPASEPDSAHLQGHGPRSRVSSPTTRSTPFPGHSARVGAAQDMVAAGIELPAILQAGRWRSAAMVARYGERLLARRGAAAQLARLQGRE